MFAMFNQFFSALAKLFSAAEKSAASLDNLAAAGELMSRSYLKEMNIRDQAKTRDLMLELGVTSIEDATVKS